MKPPGSTFVFNVVWTGSVFPYLRRLVASQFHHSDARFRFVANGCPPGQVRMMKEFAAAHAERVVEVFVSSTAMERHGAALDAVLEARDDGDYFCFVDPDIVAERPFIRSFADALENGCAGVTSGRGIWNNDVTVPPGHRGVPGECFYSADGFLFGSPHFAMYRVEPLRETMSRWGVGFGSVGGGDLPQRAKTALVAAGHEYWLYDTAKIVNILLQEDGHRLRHFEHPALLHIGGMSHYLSPPEADGEALAAGEEPDQRWPWPPARLAVARHTASLLRALCEDQPLPAPPSGLDPDLAARLARVREALIGLFPERRAASSTTKASPAQSMDM
jgi:hypothetical protein